MAAFALVATLVAVVFGNSWVERNDRPPSKPPFAQEQELGAFIPPVEDPRIHPGFDEAYDTVCGQTIVGLEALYRSAAAGTPNLTDSVDGQYRALTQRIENVYNRDDLWQATDPLVLEYAEAIADDLASILDGTDIGFEYLDGDVTIFRSLCDDWFTPI